MRNKKVLFLTQAALIAAIYVALTYVMYEFGLSSGSVQLRLSEALCILPFFTPAAIPGLFIGCLLANTIAGGVIWDIIFGSLATLIGAIGTYLLRKAKPKFLCTLPPVLANAFIIPAVLIHCYGIPSVVFKGVDVTYWFTALTVGIGEVICICVVGYILLIALNKVKYTVFKNID